MRPKKHYRITTPVKLRLLPKEDRRKPQPMFTKPISLTCQHRGDQIRTMRSDICGQRGHEIPVYACDLHGECTHRQACKGQDASVRICLGCGDGPWAAD